MNLSEYKGKCIALVNEKVVAVGKNQLEAYNQAKSLHPAQRIFLMYVPNTRETITFL